MATNTNVASTVEDQYFYEDVVYRVDKKGNVEFGIIMENDDQDFSDDSSANEESPKKKKGEIRVVWHPSGVEELVNSKKVLFISFNLFALKSLFINLTPLFPHLQDLTGKIYRLFRPRRRYFLQ